MEHLLLHLGCEYMRFDGVRVTCYQALDSKGIAQITADFENGRLKTYNIAWDVEDETRQDFMETCREDLKKKTK